MHWNTKEKALIAVTTLVTLASLVHADTNGSQVRNLENRVTALEQRKGASGMVNPPARPQVRNGADLFVYGDLLYWKANENGLPLAVVNKGSFSNMAHSKVENLNGSWDFAFRVGLGYDIPHDGWDLSLSWLRYNGEGHHKRIHTKSNRFIFPSLTPAIDPLSSFEAAKKAKGHWRVLLNQLDLDLGREFFVSKWLTLRPHAGLRTDWIYQKAKAEYGNFTTFETSEAEVKFRDRWWGIGIEAGLDTQWGLGHGWSIYGNLAAAILYGDHHLRMHDEDEFSIAGFESEIRPARVREKIWIAHPVLDLQLGLRWDWMFAHDHLHVGIQLGWENHLYFSQNQFPQFCDTTHLGRFFANQGDLALEGWTLGLRLDF